LEHTSSYPDPPPTDISTPSLHVALPISEVTPVTVTDTDGNVDLCLRHGIDPLKPAILVTYQPARMTVPPSARLTYPRTFEGFAVDRKSTRLNSSHVKISYAVFCLKKTTT